MTRRPWCVWPALAPAVAAGAALSAGGLWPKVAVAASGALVAAMAGAAAKDARQAPLAAGLAAAAVGDYLLALGGEGLFLAGVAAFAVAHACYLAWSVRYGGMNRPLFGALLTAALAWFAAGLAPRMGLSVLSAAVLAYAVLSLLTLSSAPALRKGPAVRVAFTLGVALLVVSDVCIALSRFQGIAAASPFVLPLYFAAQVSVTVAALLATGQTHREGDPYALSHH